MSFPAFALSLIALIFSLAQPAPAQEPSRKVLFLGNSITLHGPKADIDWTGNRGMAASVANRAIGTDILCGTASLATSNFRGMIQAPMARCPAQILHFPASHEPPRHSLF